MNFKNTDFVHSNEGKTSGFAGVYRQDYLFRVSLYVVLVGIVRDRVLARNNARAELSMARGRVASEQRGCSHVFDLEVVRKVSMGGLIRPGVGGLIRPVS